MLFTDKKTLINYPKFRIVPRLIFLSLIFLNSHVYAQDKEKANINVQDLRDWLINAPSATASESTNKFILIDLPISGSNTETFAAFETTVLSDAMQKRYPDIKTYNLKTMDGTYNGKITISNKGVDGSIFGSGERVMIESLAEGNQEHLVYQTESSIHQTHNEDGDIFYDLDYENRVGSHRHSEVEDFHTHQIGVPATNARSLPIETNLRTIRAWIITDGEYSEAVDNNGAVDETEVVNAITAAMTSITAIYERDLGVKLILAGTTVYTNPSTDIFPNAHTNNGFATQALQAFEQLVITDGTVNENDFDIGHVFSGNGSGGSGYLGVACQGNINTSYGSFSIGKGGGGSGLGNPSGSDWVDLVAHEMGHQFNALHTWSGQSGSCTAGQFSNQASVEPGSGTTLMSYSNSCSADNVPNVGNGSYFHIFSIEEIDDYLNDPFGGNCEGLEVTNNSAPSIDLTACSSLNIPIGTPFELTGTATDPNGDGLSYIWEQVDLAPAQADADQQANSTTNPIFRSFAPSSSTTRSFPQSSDVATNNYNTNNAGVSFSWNGELLPTVARAMKFKFTVKDGNGGISTQQITVNTHGTSSADYFTMSAPNGGETLTAGSSTTVTWNVNGTDGGSINCNSVDILLSTDGGQSFPITLVTNTTNDGTHTFTLPAGLPSSSQAKIKISCGNDCIRFFDISNEAFTISSSCTEQSSLFSPQTDVSATQGDAGLNLSLMPDYGTSYTNFTGTLDNTDGSSNLAYSNNTTKNGPCGGPSNSNYYEAYTIYPNTTGSYSFSVASGDPHVNIYLGDYDPNSVCSNFLGSMVHDGDPNDEFLDISSSLSVNLTAGVKYTLVVAGFSTNSVGNYTFNYDGGTLYNGIPAPSNSYTYTYIAVSNTGVISAISASSDFTSLSAGTYTVYGVTIPTADVANFNAYLNTNISAIYNGVVCITLSNNTITLTANAPACTNPTPSLGTTTNPTTCGGSEGSIQLTGLTANTSYTLNHKRDGVAQAVSPIMTDGSGNYTMTNLSAGAYTEINVTISTCTSSNLSTNDNTNTGIAANGTGNISAITTTNAGVSTIQVTPSLNSCTGTTTTFMITVNSASATCTNDMLGVNASIDNATYNCDTVSSAETIPTNFTIVYEGCEEVILKPGFHAAPTGAATFTARINCSALTSPDSKISKARINTNNSTIPINLAMTLSPNPANDFINIAYQLAEVSAASIGLYDLAGKKLMDIVPIQTQAKGNYQQQFNLGNLQAGMYFVLLQTEREQISKKLILVR